MTPEIIRTISKLRNDFYTSFATAMPEPVKISGNSYNSLASIASWVDSNQWLNYITIYAYLAPDALVSERPFVLRCSINKGAGTVALPRHGQVCRGVNQQWSFELTILPEELLDFLPWIVDLVQAQTQGLHSLSQRPPHPLNPDFFVSVKSAHFWTLAAERLVKSPNSTGIPVSSGQLPSPVESFRKHYRSEVTELSSRRLFN
ncbi:MAG: hypothetical protein ACP5RH_08670 [Leptodesmis sp.]|uniref:hypothetical protein n=1 Tax=Leptodesmis sp. TaxID=3100501 RepID=UPI003D10FB05